MEETIDRVAELEELLDELLRRAGLGAFAGTKQARAAVILEIMQPKEERLLRN